MEAHLPLIEAATADEARIAFDQEVQARAAIAFAADCRLAIHSSHCGDGCCLTYDFVVLSPGERAPKGWTIYENYGGVAVGRSA